MESAYLVFSDVHGDNEVMELLREKEKKYNALALISAGDLTPEPYNPIYEGIIGCRGNSDRYFSYQTIPYPNISITLNLFGHKAYVTHGDRMSKEDFPLSKGDIFITGHTHVPLLKEENGIYFLNPGSPSFPRSSFGPTFSLVFENRLTILSLMDEKVIFERFFSLS